MEICRFLQPLFLSARGGGKKKSSPAAAGSLQISPPSGSFPRHRSPCALSLTLRLWLLLHLLCCEAPCSARPDFSWRPAPCVGPSHGAPPWLFSLPPSLSASASPCHGAFGCAALSLSRALDLCRALQSSFGERPGRPSPALSAGG
jgi:hypothetical protein